MLSEGDDAPRIEATNQDGDSVTVKYEEPTVVYFYPRDDTPGCTMEAKSFNKEYDEYEAAGVRVYGVSTDDEESHCDFAEENDLSFDLLADPDAEIADAFGVPLQGNMAKRNTFVVVDGEVVSVYENVSPDGHGRDLLLELIEDGVVEL
jgi:peroxiredoxin Q/BCP